MIVFFVLGILIEVSNWVSRFRTPYASPVCLVPVIPCVFATIALPSAENIALTVLVTLSHIFTAFEPLNQLRVARLDPGGHLMEEVESKVRSIFRQTSVWPKQITLDDSSTASLIGSGGENRAVYCVKLPGAGGHFRADVVGRW